MTEGRFENRPSVLIIILCFITFLQFRQDRRTVPLSYLISSIFHLS